MKPLAFVKIRLAAGMSQRELALILRCQSFRVSEWETGRREIPLVLATWMRALNRGKAGPAPSMAKTRSRLLKAPEPVQLNRTRPWPAGLCQSCKCAIVQTLPCGCSHGAA